MSDWSLNYQQHLKTLPKPGTILRCYGHEPVRLHVELKEGTPPLVFGMAYVPSIVGHELGWYLHPIDSKANYGRRAILMPKARTEAFQKCQIENGFMSVASLRVVRVSASGYSLLCEVHKYLEPPTEAA